MPARTKSLLSCWGYLFGRVEKLKLGMGQVFSHNTQKPTYLCLEGASKSQSHAFYAKFGLSLVLLLPS